MISGAACDRGKCDHPQLKTLLVVDDEPANISLIRMVVEESGVDLCRGGPGDLRREAGDEDDSDRVRRPRRPGR
jgi:CheY-like chemotaxis protein